LCEAGLSWSYLDRPLHGLLLQASEPAASSGSPRGSSLAQAPETTPLKLWKNPEEPKTTGLLWSKEDRGERYSSRLELHRTQQGLLLKIHCEGSGSFEYRPEGIGIHWKRGGTGPEHYFQTLGAALWLELQGIPCIHANALDTGKGAIGLIAPSRTGKTTLTASLLKAGLRLMTDDMLALHHVGGQWLVQPGWPQLRMWPDTARRYAGEGVERLPRVHERFEKRIVHLEPQRYFCSQEQPLKRLYLLERRESEKGETETTDIPPGEALVHLLQNSMLKKLAQVLEAVPLTRIRYPSGLHHLGAVCQRIVDAQQ